MIFLYFYFDNDLSLTKMNTSLGSLILILMFGKYILLKCFLLFQNNENILQKVQLWPNP